MTNPNKFHHLDKIFIALGNHHRREIVYLVGLQPHSISLLASARNLTLPAIHKHIKILEEANLVIHRKIGRTRFLSLNRETLLSLQTWIIQYQPYWGNNQETLENYAKFLQRKKARKGVKKQ